MMLLGCDVAQSTQVPYAAVSSIIMSLENRLTFYRRGCWLSARSIAYSTFLFLLDSVINCFSQGPPPFPIVRADEAL